MHTIRSLGDRSLSQSRDSHLILALQHHNVAVALAVIYVPLHLYVLLCSSESLIKAGEWSWGERCLSGEVGFTTGDKKKTGPEGSRGPVKKKLQRRRWGTIGHAAIASHVIIGHCCDLIRVPPGSDELNPFYLSLFWMSLSLTSGLYVPTVEGDVTLWMQ